MIGKRKRDTAVASRSSKTEDEEQASTVPDTSAAHDLFRKFFEAQFEPLELPGGQINREKESQEDEQDYSDGSESGSEWDVCPRRRKTTRLRLSSTRTEPRRTRKYRTKRPGRLLWYVF
jgi:hypothetical protein